MRGTPGTASCSRTPTDRPPSLPRSHGHAHRRQSFCVVVRPRQPQRLGHPPQPVAALATNLSYETDEARATSGSFASSSQQEEGKLLEFITNAESWVELQKLLRKHPSTISPATAAAMIIRVSQVHQPWQSEKLPKLRAFLADLARLIGSSLERTESSTATRVAAAHVGRATTSQDPETAAGDPSALAANGDWLGGAFVLIDVLGGLAALRVWKVDPFFLESSFRLLGMLPASAWHPRQFAVTAHAAGALRQSPEWLVAALAGSEEAAENLVAGPMQWGPDDYEVPEVVLLVRAYSALQLQPPPPLLRSLLDRLQSERLQLSASDISAALHLISVLRHLPPEPWMATMLEHLLAKPGWKQPEDLAAVIRALAVLEYHPGEQWLAQYSVLVMRFAAGYSPRHTVWTLEALTALGHRPEDMWLELFLMQVRSQLVLFSTSEIASLLESLAWLEFTPRKKFREHVLEELLRWGRSGMHPRDTGRIIWAAAALKLPVSFKFMQKMLHGARDRLGELATPELVGLVVSVAGLNQSRPSEEWMRGLEAVVEVRVAELSAVEAGELAWALCRLSWVPREVVVEGLLTKVVEGVNVGAWEGQAEGLAKVVEACEFWEVAVPAAVVDMCGAASDRSDLVS